MESTVRVQLIVRTMLICFIFIDKIKMLGQVCHYEIYTYTSMFFVGTHATKMSMNQLKQAIYFISVRI